MKERAKKVGESAMNILRMDLRLAATDCTILPNWRNSGVQQIEKLPSGASVEPVVSSQTSYPSENRVELIIETIIIF